jgi:hypothetical protein
VLQPKKMDTPKFDMSTANCGAAPQSDFVVFNTSVNGTSTQASVVAYENLYSGCGGNVPSTYWAYNTGGSVVTSVALSLRRLAGGICPELAEMGEIELATSAAPALRGARVRAGQVVMKRRRQVTTEGPRGRRRWRRRHRRAAEPSSPAGE